MMNHHNLTILDRTYYPPAYDDEDECVDSRKLYAVEARQDALPPPKSNMCPLQEDNDQNGMANIEDSSSVIEADVKDDINIERARGRWTCSKLRPHAWKSITF